MRLTRLLVAASLPLLTLSITSCDDGSTSSTSGGKGGDEPQGGGGSGGGGTGGQTGGQGGTGGTGGTGGGTSVCTPGEEKPCYNGPDGTLGIGLCKEGTQTCKANGEGFGDCTGAVIPVAETCATLGDDDCDGQVNEDGEGCNCTPGDVQPCYSGPADTMGVGTCSGGQQFCKVDATGFGPCEGEILPESETCLTIEDDDCDGQINEEGDGCVCVPGTTAPCYSGPDGTLGVGICSGGAAFCNFSGTAYGPCSGEVLPQLETCFTAEDDDCDGQINEDGAGCVCTPGSMVPCYSGPPGTLGVGACQPGNAQCNVLGTGIGACFGETLPQVETCLTAVDDDCDGQVNEDGEGCSCAPGATKPCYSGPSGTQGVGACVAGVQTCLPNGSGYGACAGEVLPTVENCQTAANEDCSVDPDCGAALWAKRFGSTGDQQVNAVARDALGNVLVAGRFAGSFTFAGSTFTSAGGYDLFFAKMDSAGNALWAKRAGDAAIYQEAFDIAADNLGNVLVAGYFEGSITLGGTTLTSQGATDVFLAKLDPSGNLAWAKQFGAAAAQYGQSVATDAQGNILLLVNGFGSVDFGGGMLTSAGNYDIFLAKFDPSGAHLWSKRFGAANTDLGQAVAVDSQGNAVLTGRTDAPLDFGGGALPAPGGLDAIVVKFDPLGSFIWNQRYGDGANQFGSDVATDVQNNVYITGGFEGTVNLGGAGLTAVGAVDVFLAKLQASGAHVWSRRYGGAGAAPSIVALAPGPFGDLLLVGQVDGTIDFGGGALPPFGGVDSFVVRLDSQGNHAWSKRYGSAGNQYFTGAAVDGLGRLFVGGSFEQTLDFGLGNLTSAGGLDWFVAKLIP
ncbi:MAG: hypothetical protein IPK82_40675 [Polyangiaceae bacterium]|nr:hypothetical protein [Polyangiaceae bacterium]